MTAPLAPVFAVARLPRNAPTAFLAQPDPAALRALAETLGVSEVRKLRFEGALLPEGKRDWLLQGTLGATLVQPCVVTWAPVTTRIDEPVTRSFRADLAPMPEGTESEMPEDDTIEPLPAAIDAGAVLTEALTLAVPAYPRVEGAPTGDRVHTEPGNEALTDETARPLAGLAAFRERLSKESSDED